MKTKKLTDQQIVHIIKTLGISKEQIQKATNQDTGFWFCLKGFKKIGNDYCTLNLYCENTESGISISSRLNRKNESNKFTVKKILNLEETKAIIPELCSFEDANKKHFLETLEENKFVI